MLNLYPANTGMAEVERASSSTMDLQPPLETLSLHFRKGSNDLEARRSPSYVSIQETLC